MKRRRYVLITSGPTREPIDRVRFLSNYSTGYMGVQLATEALSRGCRVTVISGPSCEQFPTAAQVIPVEQTVQMERVLRRHSTDADAVIMAAAVSDYRPVRVGASKLPRAHRRTLRLQATPDLIARLPRRRGQVVVGFALETSQVISRATRKLHAKRLDVLLAQQADSVGSPFGRQRVRAWLLQRGKAPQALGRISKRAVARLLLDKVEALWYGQRRLNRPRQDKT